MAWRPKFDSIYSGEWPYPGHEGVGLYITGFPTDIQMFVKVLGYHGCHPSATERILERLLLLKEDRLTVSHSLDFDEVAQSLLSLGVQISIIPPQPGWVERFPKGEWPQELIDWINQERKRRGLPEISGGR